MQGHLRDEGGGRCVGGEKEGRCKSGGGKATIQLEEGDEEDLEDVESLRGKWRVSVCVCLFFPSFVNHLWKERPVEGWIDTYNMKL